MSDDAFNQETYDNNYIKPHKQEVLQIIKNQLKPLYLLTKCLEGNIDLKDNVYKASYRSLQEVLPILEEVLDHFEGLEKQAKNGDFNNYLGI